MPVLALDLGGTKLAIAVFSEDGAILAEERVALEKRHGESVGALMASRVNNWLATQKATDAEITSIGIAVPGICYRANGTVWAPNIRGWEAYPLREEIQNIAGTIPVSIDSDRACYILGESWKGAAQGCTDAIFLAVGTGIGAGILVHGSVLRGAHDIGGAIGWMALERPFHTNYSTCGCFESRASGDGMTKLAKAVVSVTPEYTGVLRSKLNDLTAGDVFEAHEENDAVAEEVIDQCIELWGMAVANLVSLFDPEKIVLGGGVFGPAVKFIPDIRAEAVKWAQPISMDKVIIEASVLGNHAGLYGAGLLALKNTRQDNLSNV